MGSLESYPLGTRISNALVSYVGYIGKMIWPHHLAFFYPYPNLFPLWQVAGAGLLLLFVSVLLIRAVRRRPYLMVGWFWYLGTLVPVIGLVQVGSQAMADRYTYVPLVGLFIVIATGVPDFLAGWRYRRIVLVISAGLLLSILMIVTRLQIQHWHNGVTLFKHSLDVTANNSLSQNGLGVALARQGKHQEAIDHYGQALRIKPDYAEAYGNLGNSLAEQGRIEEAIVNYTEALRINPDFAEAHFFLGLAYLMIGNRDSALEEHKILKTINPNLANTLSHKIFK